MTAGLRGDAPLWLGVVLTVVFGIVTVIGVQKANENVDWNEVHVFDLPPDGAWGVVWVRVGW